jgi:hypothetical protein
MAQLLPPAPPAAGSQLVHRLHHGAVLDILVGLDDDDALFLAFEHFFDATPQVAGLNLDGVDEEPLVGRDGDDRLVLRLRLLGRVDGPRQRHCDALLQQGGHDHHDDQQNQHDVDERRDVDVALDTTLGAH